MKIYILLIFLIFMINTANPFNPQQPAKPHFFVGRDEEVKCFETFLFQTINDSPMNMSITGDRGMGKTSILNKFDDIARNKNCLIVRLSNYEGNAKDIVELSEYFIMSIQREIISRNKFAQVKNDFNKWLSSFKPSIEMSGVSVSFEKKPIVQDVFREKLQEIWKNIKDKYSAIVVLIDEAESLENTGALTFFREVFQRVQQNSNYMIVLAGKFNFPERMSEQFSPLNRLFPAQRLRRLRIRDISNYLKKRLDKTEVKVNKDSTYKIFKKSEGHPYVLVCISFLVFDSLNIDERLIDNQIVDRCQSKIRSKLSQDFFTPMFHPLSPQAKRIICRLARSVKGLKFNSLEARKITGMENNQISPYFGEFIKRGILTKPSRGTYWIFHTLFKEYLIFNSHKYTK
jgi:nucleoside-triphosphatase THEP1